jgi:D-lactate dehydrogenase (cytochrome)
MRSIQPIQRSFSLARTPLAPRSRAPPAFSSLHLRHQSTQSPRQPNLGTYKVQGGPVPRPKPLYLPSGGQPRARWVQIMVNGQLIFGGVVLLVVGYYIGTNRAPPAPPAPPAGLQPSIVAIAAQESNQPQYGSLEDYKALIGELRLRWNSKGKEDKVSTDKEDLETHGVSDWSYHEAKRPTVVVWAESTEEVQEVVLLARKWKVPITPFAGGTSLEGHFSSVRRGLSRWNALCSSTDQSQPYGGISLDLSLMDKIISVSTADADAVVQPGVKWEDLNKHLADQKIDLFFPLDPGPGATIGGMAGTGCSGTNAVRYGTAKAEWFLNLVSSADATRH